MELRVLKPGTYNNKEGFARKKDVGDLLITSVSYGQSLIDDGFAEPWRIVTVEVAFEDVPEKAKIVVGAEMGEDFLGQPVNVLTEIGISQAVVMRMKVRGLETLQDIDIAADDELLAVPGIGNKVLEKLRQFVDRLELKSAEED